MRLRDDEDDDEDDNRDSGDDDTQVLSIHPLANSKSRCFIVTTTADILHLAVAVHPWMS